MSLTNLLLSCYPDRVEYVDQVLIFDKIKEYVDRCIFGFLRFFTSECSFLFKALICIPDKRQRTTNADGGSISRVASWLPFSPNGKTDLTKKTPKARTRAGVGYFPGRSFVGRVSECGWDVRDEVVKKGEWVGGFMGVRKVIITLLSDSDEESVDLNLLGTLAAFVVVDRHRVRRVPHPWKTTPPPTTPQNPQAPYGSPPPLHHNAT